MVEPFLSEGDFARLTGAILCLKSEAEVRAFLTDICTVKEIQDISLRLSVAYALHQGMNYTDIAKKTGASSATISRVSRCLRYGDNGYRLVLERCGDEPAANAQEAQ